MTITPQLIKELRDRTGVGIGKCKEALEEADGDLNVAIENLRKSGMASAVKKEGRTANEGSIGIGESDTHIALVEVNAETDFVVNNERFQNFLKDAVEEILATTPSSLEEFLAQKCSKEPSLTIDEYRATIVQAIGENIQIRRLAVFEKGSNYSLGVYSHLGGKIVTLVRVDGSPTVQELAKDIAMHVAAAHPECINPEDISSKVIEQEKEIARSQVAGKPKNVIEKIVEGKIAKYFDEVCLNRQHFIKDDSLRIEDLVKKQGDNLAITCFERWTVGQN